MGMISHSPTVRNAGPHLNRWRAYSLAAKAKLSDEFYSLPGGAAPIASWRSSDPKTQALPKCVDRQPTGVHGTEVCRIAETKRAGKGKGNGNGKEGWISTLRQHYHLSTLCIPHESSISRIYALWRNAGCPGRYSTTWTAARKRNAPWRKTTARFAMSCFALVTQ